VELLGPSDLTFVVEPGVLDERARLAFGTGQCHGLALAVHRQFGWQLVAVDDAAGTCMHVCVRRPDGRLVDANGAHATEDFESGNTFRDIGENSVDDLVEHEDWAEPEVEKAAAWVDAIIEQASESPAFRAPRKNAVMRLTRGLGDLEVRIVWEGEPWYEVLVRRSSHGDEPWIRYGDLKFPRDSRGRYKIDFRPEVFERVAGAFLRRQFNPAKAEAKLANAP
jgi:hypothetical protein